MTEPKWTHGEELQQRVECGVDFGNVVGFFVRMSVIRDDGKTEWVSLTPDEAEVLANGLRKAAEGARIEQDRWHEGPQDPPVRTA